MIASAKSLQGYRLMTKDELIVKQQLEIEELKNGI